MPFYCTHHAPRSLFANVSQRYMPVAFSPLLPIVAIYYAFCTQCEVWSSQGHSVLVPYSCLFIISRQRGYIARYICVEHTHTRIIYIAFRRQC